MIAKNYPLLALVSLACSGCAEVIQSDVCAQYVTCLADRDAAQGTQTDVERFVAGGPCWEGAEGAELCTNACERGLDFLATHETNTPESCLP